MEWKVQAKGGFIMTSGNSQATNITFGVKGSRKEGNNKLELEGGMAYGRSSNLVADVDKTTASPILTGFSRDNVVSTNKALWTTSSLREVVFRSHPSMRKTQLGRDLLAASRRLLAKLGRPDASALSVEDVAGAAEILAGSRFNGDGIVPADSADDEPTRRAIEDIIKAVGGKPDRSGKPGVDQPTIDKFFEEAAATVAWLDQAERDASIQPLGSATSEAAAAVDAVRAKVDDYFGCATRLPRSGPRGACI
jgi:hypothetical protein